MSNSQRIEDIGRRCQLNWHKFPIGAIPALVAEGAIAKALKVCRYDNPYTPSGSTRISPLSKPVFQNGEITGLLDETDYKFMDKAAESSWLYGWIHSDTILEM